MGHLRSRDKTSRTSVRAWHIAGNFFFGVGRPIGWLAVDPMSGAMWALDKDCGARLAPGAASFTSDTSSLKVVCVNSVPDYLRPHLCWVD
ncbi:MAG: hypothetical protein JW955_06140 [Sedimentisphaerales bacterium]|nr:hypothetical protein [Sedimentisphaerales bacterium]